jgi:hypothetical protein
MKKYFANTLAVLFILSTVGCSHFSMSNYPTFDQELIYDQPYDFTYLRTMEALNTFPDWILESTDKEKGEIVFRNTDYGHLFDRDKGYARFRVTRLSRTQTSVMLDPSTQTIREGGDLLKRIDQMMFHGATKQEPPPDVAAINT